MLRIQRSENGDVIYKLIGRIDNENVAELEALLRAETGGERIVLDLKDVTLAGQDGVTFLAGCEESDITLANCPGYVREWIVRQRGGK